MVLFLSPLEVFLHLFIRVSCPQPHILGVPIQSRYVECPSQITSHVLQLIHFTKAGRMR